MNNQTIVIIETKPKVDKNSLLPMYYNNNPDTKDNNFISSCNIQ